MVVNGRLQEWIFVLICLLIVIRKVQGSTGVNITYVLSGVAKGAVCLDGSPPAYHLDRGYGTGVNSWLVQLEGGGWCNNVTTCLSRKKGRLGSSKLMKKELPFSGNLNNKRRFNPDFYNWNRVKVRYCDGSSFTGDVERVDPATKIYHRGARVFLAVIEDLLAKGMKNAENAILSGCSAGGLATIIHCDSFKALLPMGTKVKCFSDAGFFLHAKDIMGAQRIEAYFNDIVTTHGSAKTLPRSCTSRMKPSLCLFPQYTAQAVRTPLFFINSAYDSWMVKNSLAPQEADHHSVWKNCRTEIYDCTPSQLKFLQDYRQQFIKALTGLGSSSSRGYFINSCYDHCQTEQQGTWLWNKQQLLANKSIAKAAGDWFFDRAPFQHIDCPYPCDKTCRSHEILT